MDDLGGKPTILGNIHIYPGSQPFGPLFHFLNLVSLENENSFGTSRSALRMASTSNDALGAGEPVPHLDDGNPRRRPLKMNGWNQKSHPIEIRELIFQTTIFGCKMLIFQGVGAKKKVFLGCFGKLVKRLGSEVIYVDILVKSTMMTWFCDHLAVWKLGSATLAKFSIFTTQDFWLLHLRGFFSSFGLDFAIFSFSFSCLFFQATATWKERSSSGSDWSVGLT